MAFAEITTTVIVIGEILLMSHKTSCRSCGNYLVPTGICTVCHENVLWSCSLCGAVDDVTHVHDYCTVAYKKIEVQVKQPSQ